MGAPVLDTVVLPYTVELFKLFIDPLIRID